MGRTRYEVFSEYGAWAPNPELLNQVLDGIHRVLNEESADSTPDQVRRVLNRLVPAETQATLRLAIRPLLSEFHRGSMASQ